MRKLGVRSVGERNRPRWKYYIKGILKKYSGRAWIGLICFRIGVTSVNTVLNLWVPFLEQQRNYQLLQKDSAPWRQ